MSKKFNGFDKIKDDRLPSLYAEIGLDYPSGVTLAKMAEYDAMPVLEVAAWVALVDEQADPRTADGIDSGDYVDGQRQARFGTSL